MTTATPKPHTPFVAYYRVSTKGQQKSGLGLDAQRAAVRDYIRHTRGRLVAEFTEAESGRSITRPQLHAALARCRNTGAALIIAKLDRLARNVHFLSGLIRGDVEFIALDVPGANKFTLHVLAAVAEQEAALASERTKAGLAQAKKRGKRLGGRRPNQSQAEAHAARREMARAHYVGSLVTDLVLAWRKDGQSYQEIAEALTRRQVRTTTGGTNWTASMARRVVLLAQEAA